MNKITQQIFRGNRIDNGEWVRGWHIECDGQSYICPKAKDTKWDLCTVLAGFIEVHPDSVSMGTGICFADDNSQAFIGDFCFRKMSEPTFQICWDSYHAKVYLVGSDDIKQDASFIRVCQCLGNTTDDSSLVEEFAANDN